MHPHNLPTQLTSFIGREREIPQVRRFLSTTRLLTLTGAGGVGKTRLALQVAAQALADFRDGVWIVDLAPLADPALLPQTVASVLSVSEKSGRLLSDTLVAELRDKSLLLVLDNCEHVRQACARLADILLRGCRHVRIFATSREPLSVPGETLWRVPSLSLPDPARILSLEHVRLYEAVRLFVERAQAGRPGVALTAANASALVQICHRLDGIPLAIELAAARTRVLAVEQIAARLDDRFGLLTGGSSSVLPRHQTLRATMDWSYDLLAGYEQGLLRRLSVFAGGWTLEAAEAICAKRDAESPTVLDQLTSLVDKSLVIVDVTRGEARYRLLETVRQYGRDRLDEAGDAAAVRQQHRDWYLRFAEQADAKLYTSEQGSWLQRLEAEHDNLRTALEWSRDEKDGASASLRLAGALGWFWYLHGHWSEGRRWLENTLARARDALPTTTAKALLGAGRITWFQGDAEQARPLFERGLALSRQLGQRELLPGFCYWVGRLSWGRGDIQSASALLEEGLTVCRERGDTWWACQLLAERGEVARSQGDYAQAAELYLEGLGLSRATGGINNSMLFLHNLGVVALHEGHLQQAADYYRESLLLCKEVQHRAITTGCLEGLARVASARGDYTRAARLFGAVDVVEKSLGQRWRADEDDRARRAATAETELGQAAFRQAWDEGRAMPLEDAIEYGLGSPSGLTSSRAPGGLTAREREVAALVSQGLTNRQIAARLVVTERTAETHVQNILNKLGFDSRAQVAAWAVEQGLSTPTRQ